MSKAFDELMKLLQEKGDIPEDKAKEIIKEHGDLKDDEKKDLAAAIKMKKALKTDDKPADKKPAEDKKDAPAEGEKKDEDKDKDKKPKAESSEEVTMDDYLQALSTLDSEDATKEEKEKAEKVKEKFESG